MAKRLLVAFHGMLPRPGRPVVGNGLRARALGQGCASAGFDVFYAATHLGEPPDPEWPETHRLYPYEQEAGLRPVLDRVDPDVLILCQVEELKNLPPLHIPVVADLFAPRVLESQFQEFERETEVIQRIAALTRADAFLCTNQRQRHYYLSWLLLAGVDVRHNPLCVVPLGVDPEAPEREKLPEAPVFVTGGVGWPWIDSGPAVNALVGRLDERQQGTVDVFGGAYLIKDGQGAESSAEAPEVPESDRVRQRGLVPYDQLLGEYRRATAALDAPLPNSERELAMSFRTLDYLSSGLPVIVSGHSPVARTISVAQAGWVVDPADPASVTAAVDRILDDPEEVALRGANARRLALERFAWDKAVVALVDLLQAGLKVRERRPSLLRTVVDVADRALVERREHLETLRKYERLVEETREARTGLERSLEELRGAREDQRRLEDQLQTVRQERDSVEMKRAQVQQDLENSRNDLVRLERELGQARPALADAERRLTEAEGFKRERNDLNELKVRLEGELTAARRQGEQAQTEAERHRVAREGEARRADDAVDKQHTLTEALDAAVRERDKAREQLALAQEEATRKSSRAQELEQRVGAVEAELAQTISRGQSDLGSRDRELEERRNQLDQTKAARDHLERRVAELEAHLDEQRRRLDAANHELSAAQRELAAIRANPLVQLKDKLLRKK